MESALWRPYVIVLIVPPIVHSYIYGLLTTVTDNLRSICSTTAIAVSSILLPIPQKVTEIESEASGEAVRDPFVSCFHNSDLCSGSLYGQFILTKSAFFHVPRY